MSKVPIVMAVDGLGDLGQSSADYSRVNDLQNRITTVRAGIYSIGKDLWDTVSGAVYRAGKIPMEVLGGYFPGFDWASDESLKILQSLIVTEDRFPSATSQNLAAQRINEFGSMIAYIKKVAPELASRVQADMTQAKQKVEAITPLKSPGEVGWETFKQEVADRASALASSIGFGAGLGVVAIAALAVLFFMGRR